TYPPRAWTFTGSAFTNLGLIQMPAAISNNPKVIVASRLDGTADLTILGATSNNAGEIWLTASNGYSGITRIGGTSRVVISNSWALGSTDGYTYISNGTALHLRGDLTLNETFALRGEGNVMYQGAINSVGGFTNTLLGAITNTGGGRVGAASGNAGLIVAGGVVGSGSLSVQAAGLVIFTNNPVLLPGAQISSHSGGKTIMAVSGNNIATLQVGYGNTFIFGVDDAFPSALHLQVGGGLGGWQATVDLNGHTVIVGRLSNYSSNAPGCVIRSTAPATLIVNQSVNTAVTNRMIGPITLAKDGSGILTVDGPMAHTGKTIVSNGILQIGVNGSISNSPTIEAVGNGTLALPAGGYTFLVGQTVRGTGRISGGLILDTGATLAPGMSAGTLTVSNDVSLLSGSFFSVEIDGISSGEYDQLSMVGIGDTLTLGGTLQVADSAVFTPLLDAFTIVTGFETLNGTFQGLPDNALFATANNTYRINYNADNVTLTAVVPEPTTLGLLSVAVLLLRRRRRG
ncbi:MAG: PEP-CTERM sorting domain-containing protein, partial [Verrucomicrobia bacterium]|nr:PEP-CTERM sorting domain-containing protein [Verrucomicrobiota bacterium]